jgi:hypothetical protein
VQHYRPLLHHGLIAGLLLRLGRVVHWSVSHPAGDRPDSGAPLYQAGESSDTTISEVAGTELGGLDGFVGGEAEADVVGGPPAFGIKEFRTQNLLDFGNIGGSFDGEQG